MRELIKSVISFSLAVPLYGVKQVAHLLSHKELNETERSTASTLDAVRETAQEKMGERMQALYKSGDILQRSAVDLIFRAVSGNPGKPEAPSTVQTSAASVPEGFTRGRLDASIFVVLGEGMAAGMGDFGLSEAFQTMSFPALIARQMRTPFNQPLIEPPGIGDVIGFPRLPVRVPGIMQMTALRDFPPSVAIHNLSIPGLRISDVRTLRPAEPLVHRNDAKQTLANLMLGMPDLMHKQDGPLMTPLDYALKWKPTFAVLALGYTEMVEAAVAQDGARLPDPEAFCSEYAQILTDLKAGGCEVLVMTIPDPADTAFFSPIESAASVLKVQPEWLLSAYDLSPGDRITVSGLVDIGCHLIAGESAPLTAGATASAGWMDRVSTHVQALNHELTALAGSHGAVSYDLNHFFHRIRETGISLGSRRFSADFLGGFYELNGYCPGPTGHALIANEVLRLLNRTFGAHFPMVDTGSIMAADPVADYRLPEGPVLTAMDISRKPEPEEADFSPAESPSETPAPEGASPSGVILEEYTPVLPLTLPASREQVLPINQEASYYGDAIRAVHCRNPEEGKWGSGGELLFGGLAMVDSHLSGNIRIRFSEPVNQVTHFEVSLEKGLTGDDGMLTAPQFFKLPAHHNSVKDDPQLVSSGDLDLETGKVENLAFHFRFMNTALLSLVRANPKFPDVPISFPGKYGSAWARFEQRPDGNLDFTFYGTTFVPLGMVLPDTIRFPLPFCSPTLQYASIPARGCQLHPHIHLSTRPPVPADGIIPPELPTNTIYEFTAYAHNTCFGDKFSLNIPELGGEATGRSHLMGRVEVQFGERFGDSISVAVSCPSPGGLLYAPNPPPSQLSEEFPGRLYGGMQGHSEILRFPKQTYRIVTPYRLDDPFELAVGAVNVKTGRLLNEFLCRGLIGHVIFMALLKVEPRTPRASFQFRGPALFEKDGRGQLVFRFKGTTWLLYPEGYLFPAPDLTSGLVAGPNSALDPFFWIQAMHHADEVDFVKKGSRENVEASTGERFSYRYEISGGPNQSGMFEYENHTQEARFVMHRLNWVSFTNSLTSSLKPGHYDTVTFTGFGTWSKDAEPVPRLVSAQISTSKEAPYVSILIDGGFVSNVNTKPAIEDVRP